MKNKKHVHEFFNVYPGATQNICKCGSYEPTPQHTPTPWSIIEGRQLTNIKGPNGQQVGQLDMRENGKVDAAFIVKAVNCHEELVAFINACLDCKSADELMDFVQNNAEDVITKTKAK